MKLMYVALFLVVLVVSFGATYVVMGWGNWESLGGLVTMGVERVQSFITWGSQNIGALLAIITPFTGIILWIANKAYTNYKTAKNLEVTQIKSDLLASGSENFQLAKDLQVKDQEVQSLTGKLEAYESGSLNVSELTTQLAGKDTQIQRMQQNFNTMEQTYQRMIEELKLTEKVVVK